MLYLWTRRIIVRIVRGSVSEIDFVVSEERI
jgi:hypothetical protein